MLTAWSCLVPVFTGVVGALWPALGETPTLAYLGAVPVMLGIFCVSFARTRELNAAPKPAPLALSSTTITIGDSLLTPESRTSDNGADAPIYFTPR